MIYDMILTFTFRSKKYTLHYYVCNRILRIWIVYQTNYPLMYNPKKAAKGTTKIEQWCSNRRKKNCSGDIFGFHLQSVYIYINPTPCSLTQPLHSKPFLLPKTLSSLNPSLQQVFKFIFPSVKLISCEFFLDLFSVKHVFYYVCDLRRRSEWNRLFFFSRK